MTLFTRIAAAVVLAPVIGGMVAGASASAATAGQTRATTLPTVNMEATVKAAQIDPRRADDTLTPGAKSSVLLVERALQAKHLLDAQWVDGYFGSKTVDAYAQYQRSLGYTGLAANGLPGKTSLTKLGAGRFTVTKPLGPGAKIDEGGGIVVNTRTKDMLDEAQRLLGRTLTLMQGSYNVGGDPSSAGTHDGGGVVDLSVDGMTPSTRVTVARALRQVGFAAWVRDPSQGDWPFHIHAAAISDTDLSSPAQHQIGDYYLGMNGLANRAPDDGPKVTIRTWEEYQRQLAATPASARTVSTAAAGRDGSCDSGEFCYYFNSDEAGSISDFTTSVSDYGTTEPSCYDFKGAGNGKGLCVKNNAASVYNRTSKTARVYFNSGYVGSFQDFAPGAKGNLNSTLKNNNASHQFLGTATGGDGTAPVRVISGNFADPGFAKFGSRYYLYRTGEGFGVSSSAYPDKGWSAVKNSMASRPQWVKNASDDNPHLWAPHVFSVTSGSSPLYVMYFNGYYPAKGANCIGIATSRSPDHGFVAQKSHAVCSTSSGYEAIDASSYLAGDGHRYMLYKTNYKNAKGWDIRAVEMDSATGTMVVGNSRSKIAPGSRIEAPSAIAHGGKVWLFTSRADYADCSYYTDVWSAPVFWGGTFTHVRTLMSRSSTGLCGPGGATVIQDGSTTRIAFHAYPDENHNGVKDSGTRQAWVGTIRWDSSGNPYLN